MTESRFVLAIDQGTTSTRAILFDRDGSPAGQAQKEFPQYFPRDGWVEHDAEEIWQSTLEVVAGALEAVGATAAQVDSIGITNQRETTVLWERASGRPVHNAIVWQDRRTAPACAELVEGGHGETVQARTGLLIDSYFSATKLAWLLDTLPGARDRAERGELAFGTIDSFLLWRLTGGRCHATDATNASRTMLFDIHRQDWDETLLSLFRIPREVLPEVRDSSADFGACDAGLFGAPIPITGIAGDQQAATFGQSCFEPGMIKSTYGTGCFALVNTGARPAVSHNRLLTTVAYRLNGEPTYALEGSIFVAGAAVKWLRDSLHAIESSGETASLAAAASDSAGVYMVPAFVGLGARYWDAGARGAIVGITLETGRPEIVRATLEAIAYQTRDLIEAMSADGAAAPVALRVDGGMVVNDWAMQFLSDILGVTVERPAVTETTALGAACLAGLHSGFYASLDSIASRWRCERVFEPAMNVAERDRRYAGWRTAVERVRSR